MNSESCAICRSDASASRVEKAVDAEIPVALDFALSETIDRGEPRPSHAAEPSDGVRSRPDDSTDSARDSDLGDMIDACEPSSRGVQIEPVSDSG